MPETEDKPKKMSIREITDEIGKIYEGMKSLVEESQNSGEPMNGEKEEQYSRMNSRLSSLLAMRDQHYRFLDAQAAASKVMDRRSEATSQTRTEGKRGDELRKFFSGDEYRNAFGRYLKVGISGLRPDEFRALSEGTNADGGFLPSDDFLATLIEKRFQANAMRQIANVIPLGTFETQVTFENGMPTATYELEAATKTESSPTFDNLTLVPRTMRCFTKVSNELLADAPSRGPAFNVESILARQFGRVMGEKEEQAFCGGNGTAPNPKGIFSFTATRVITPVETAASTAITANDLIDVIAGLPRQYREGAVWVMNDKIFWAIRKLLQVSAVTTTTSGAAGGTYSPFAWSLGDGRLQDGEPDRLLGYPVICVNNDANNTLTAGTRVAVFGNFNYFHIGEREGVSIKVARETYLEANQTGYFAFSRHASDVSILDAFRYLRMKP